MPLELSIANDGSNEVMTVKKRLRVSQVVIQRGGSITFSTERAHIDNATDTDRIVNSGPQVTRPIAANLTDEVTHGGQQVTLQAALAILGKFYDLWRAEDLAPPP